MRIAICDDNELFLKQMERKLQANKRVAIVHSFSKLEDFLCSVNCESKYDAVLMDIDWNHEKTGLDVAEELYRVSPSTKVVYVTGYTERYVQQAFLRKANASGFLMKPVSDELLEANLKKIFQESTEENEELVLKINSTLMALPQRDILFVESQDHTVVIHTKKETLSVYAKLKNIADKLPPNFIQCHKSFVVNMREIQRFRATDILLKDGTVIPVSRSRYLETKNSFFDFIGKEI